MVDEINQEYNAQFLGEFNWSASYSFGMVGRDGTRHITTTEQGQLSLWTCPPTTHFVWHGYDHDPYRLPYPRTLYAFYRWNVGEFFSRAFPQGLPGFAVATIPKNWLPPKAREDWLTIPTRSIGIHQWYGMTGCLGHAGERKMARISDLSDPDTVCAAINAFWSVAGFGEVPDTDRQTTLGHEEVRGDWRSHEYYEDWEARDSISLRFFQPVSCLGIFGLNQGIDFELHSIDRVK